MTVVAGTKPHPIYLAGRWVDSPDVLDVANPADAANPAGSTYHATADQYEEAVSAAVEAFEETRKLPAYERGRILREISAGIKARREELGRTISLEAGKPIRDALVEVDVPAHHSVERQRGIEAAQPRSAERREGRVELLEERASRAPVVIRECLEGVGG